MAILKNCLMAMEFFENLFEKAKKTFEPKTDNK